MCYNELIWNYIQFYIKINSMKTLTFQVFQMVCTCKKYCHWLILLKTEQLNGKLGWQCINWSIYFGHVNTAMMFSHSLSNYQFKLFFTDFSISFFLWLEMFVLYFGEKAWRISKNFFLFKSLFDEFVKKEILRSYMYQDGR